MALVSGSLPLLLPQHTLLRLFGALVLGLIQTLLDLRIGHRRLRGRAVLQRLLLVPDPLERILRTLLATLRLDGPRHPIKFSRLTPGRFTHPAEAVVDPKATSALALLLQQVGLKLRTRAPDRLGIGQGTRAGRSCRDGLHNGRGLGA
jgi:hypothetical protein